LAAVATAGAAAARRGQQELAAYSRVEPNGYMFILYLVETYERFGLPTMELLHELGDEVAVGVSLASFVAGAL
jgi:hypothetical protein